jgi:hypothetical protein
MVNAARVKSDTCKQVDDRSAVEPGFSRLCKKSVVARQHRRFGDQAPRFNNSFDAPQSVSRFEVIDYWYEYGETPK